METTELFDLLESSKSSVVENFKELIQENMNSVKEPWLVNGLFDYYLQTNSNRMEILIGCIREPHDRFLIDKILDSLRIPSARKASLNLLGRVVRKQPIWLYKIVHGGLVKELLTVLKTDTDVIVLLTGLLILTSVLPMLPTYLFKYTNDIFDVFGRLTNWSHVSHNIPEEHLLHLQVGLYSLFHRLYAMYPCNFLSYLRHAFGNGDKRVLFTNTIKPMLETVKMHPMLVTESKEGELSPQRWKNKEYDEIIAECALFSLDVLESGLPEEVNPLQLRTKPSVPAVYIDTNTNGFPQILRLPVSNLIQQSVNPELTDLSSLATLLDDASSAPPTPSTFMPTTASTHPHVLTVSASKTAVSPPETAVEATPENTPIQTPIKDRTSQFKLPQTSPAVKHLTFGKQTPPGSVPSSPAPHTADYVRRDSIFDPNNVRRDSFLIGRLEKLVHEQQLSTNVTQQKDDSTTTALKPIPLNLNEALNTPVGSYISTTANYESTVGTPGIVHIESIGGGPLTPMLSSFLPSSDSTLENIDDGLDIDELKNETVPMPDKTSLMAFAQRVRRLRFYSQCTDSTPSGGVPSPSSSPSAVSQRVKRSVSCPDVYKKVPESSLSSESGEIVRTPSSQQAEHPQEIKEKEEESVQPYDHLFDGSLPNFLQHPGGSHQLSSPYHLLDLCINKAATVHGLTSSKGDELALLRGQVELLHAQLLFERHRREAHALRNRSLAKRCRNIQHQEEKGYALEIQLSTVEKEMVILRKELVTQRTTSNMKEKELQHILAIMEAKLNELNKEIRMLKEHKVLDESNYGKLQDEFKIFQKEMDQKKADISRLEREMKDCKKYITLNATLKAAFETSQKEILLLGELNRRQQEQLAHIDSNQYVLHEMEQLRLTFNHEIITYKNALEYKASQMEAAVGFIQDLEAQLDDKDKTISKQKKLVQDTSMEYDAQLKSLEEKYDSVKSLNHRLELEILNLQHQLTVKSQTHGRVTSSRRISPLNGSPHNSNSDVDSAASAGGFQLSPDSPFIFGSPQFGPAPIQMNDLQRVIQESEGNGNVGSSTTFGTDRQLPLSPRRHTRGSIEIPEVFQGTSTEGRRGTITEYPPRPRNNY